MARPSSKTIHSPYRRAIREIVRRIADRFQPEKIILFGSHANGAPTSDSDVDLLVIMDSDLRPAQRSMAVAAEVEALPLPKDILVRTPEELAYRLSIRDSFFMEVVRDGQVLYERRVQG